MAVVHVPEDAQERLELPVNVMPPRWVTVFHTDHGIMDCACAEHEINNKKTKNIFNLLIGKETVIIWYKIIKCNKSILMHG